MKQVLQTIESEAAKFTVDFKKAKAELTKQLKKYDVVVTADTVKDAKLLATELNKQAADLNTRRKEAVYNVSAPIRAFEADMNHLVDMCKDGRERILKQVTAFEDKTREECQSLLESLRAELWESIGVTDEFKSAEFDDLIKLTSLTAKGSLTGKAKATLEHRVNQDKQKQIEVDMRVLELENRCYRAGLKVPLTREHVKDFLYASVDVYETRLNALIHVEVKRAKEAEEKIRDQVQSEAPARDYSKGQEVCTEEMQGTTQAVEKPVKSKDGRVIWNATIVVKVDVAENVLPERIEARLKKVLEEVGITPESIQVNKQ